jgi:hypothetical protein
LPCKHLCCCAACGMDGSLGLCPICRANIASRLSVFV